MTIISISISISNSNSIFITTITQPPISISNHAYLPSSTIQTCLVAILVLMLVILTSASITTPLSALVLLSKPRPNRLGT